MVTYWKVHCLVDLFYAWVYEFQRYFPYNAVKRLATFKQVIALNSLFPFWTSHKKLKCSLPWRNWCNVLLCLWGNPGIQLVFSPFGETKWNLNAIYLKASKTVLRWCCCGFGNWPTLSCDQVSKDEVHPTIKLFKYLLHHHHWSLPSQWSLNAYMLKNAFFPYKMPSNSWIYVRKQIKSMWYLDLWKSMDSHEKQWDELFELWSDAWMAMIRLHNFTCISNHHRNPICLHFRRTYSTFGILRNLFIPSA